MPLDISKNCDDRVVTREEIFSYPLAEKTKTYWPVSHQQLIEQLESTMLKNQPKYKLEKESFVTNKDKTRMFFKLYFRGNGLPDLIWGGRNGVDKKTSVAIASGQGVFVCSNMCISGDDVTYVRRHTRGVWGDVVSIIEKETLSVADRLAIMARKTERMKEIKITTNEGFKMLGLWRGTGILKPRQETKAFEHWVNPPFEEFEDRNLWSLYNSGTWALGQSRDPQHILQSHTDFHSAVEKEFALA